MNDQTARLDRDSRGDKDTLAKDKTVENARHWALSPRAVYEVISLEGRDQLDRSPMSLWWSGLAAGVGISASVLAEGILHHIFVGHPYQGPIENPGYTVGFILVILARLQLFTENTITEVLPVLKSKSVNMLICAARLGGVVFAANIVGVHSSSPSSAAMAA